MKIRNLNVKRGRRGFTLVEIMVVMTIIAILISILVPAVGFVRETARGSQCRASLRQFYLGFAGLADRDKAGSYTTGAFDASRDGCPDSIGWVADLVNAKVCKPIELLCPSNPCQGSEKYKDVLSAPTSAAGENTTLAKQQLGYCGMNTSMTPTDFADNFLAKGYGTNHMTTWFLVRTGLQTTGTGSSTGAVITTTNWATCKGLSGSKGPLKRRIVDQSPVTANLIPFMGDAAFGDIKDRAMDGDIVGSDGTIYLTGGAPLCESFSDGPYNRNPMAKMTASMTVFDQSAGGGVYQLENPGRGTAKVGNKQLPYLQDYRDFGPVHGGSANVLFADGSVKSFSDSNGDGFLNPGFMNAGTVDQYGYTPNDDTIELPEAEIFSGSFIENIGTSSKKTLD